MYCLHRDLRVAVHRQEDDFCVDVLRFQLAHRLESGELWHGDVGDDHVRPEAGRLGDHGAVGHGTDDVELLLQQAE